MNTDYNIENSKERTPMESLILLLVILGLSDRQLVFEEQTKIQAIVTNHFPEHSEQLPEFDGSQEYVLWLGCFAKYKMDPKFSSSVMSLVKILDKANASYGILKKEQCTGEPANRLGDKLTYNMLMQVNLEELKTVQKIITMCPHCSVNLGIEYAKYAKIDYEVYHHTQIIEQFINNGDIKFGECLNKGSLEILEKYLRHRRNNRI